MYIYDTCPIGHYVYAYFLNGTNSPYYIGMGTKKRAFATHKNVPIPDAIVIIEQNLTQLGAAALERRLIRWYGRADLNTGCLLNKTAGGHGGQHCITKKSPYPKKYREKAEAYDRMLARTSARAEYLRKLIKS